MLEIYEKHDTWFCVCSKVTPPPSLRHRNEGETPAPPGHNHKTIKIAGSEVDFSITGEIP